MTSASSTAPSHRTSLVHALLNQNMGKTSSVPSTNLSHHMDQLQAPSNQGGGSLTDDPSRAHSRLKPPDNHLIAAPHSISSKNSTASNHQNALPYQRANS